MRLIDADALIEFCAERWIPLNIDAVNMQPTIQPVATDINVGDMVSRQAAIDAIMGEYPDAHYPDWYASKIRALPSAQPEPHEGEWIVHLYKVGVSRYECDACHARCDIIYPYCPYCGEKKEGERNATN